MGDAESLEDQLALESTLEQVISEQGAKIQHPSSETYALVTVLPDTPHEGRLHGGNTASELLTAEGRACFGTGYASIREMCLDGDQARGRELTLPFGDTVVHLPIVVSLVMV